MIYYCAFYQLPTNRNTNYVGSLAANNKMDYIIETILKFSEVTIFAPIWHIRSEKGFKFHFGKKVRLKNSALYCHPFSIESKYKIIRKLNSILCRIWLFIILLKLSAKDSLILYHEPMLSNVILLAKKIRKFSLILELEESYQDASPCLAKSLVKSENRIIFNSDKFILSTRTLIDRFNIGKPCVICHGNYKFKNLSCTQVKTNLIYSGIIDTKKGGVFKAIQAMDYLPKYHLHITGTGDSIEAMLFLISKSKYQNITYHGVLTAKELDKLIESCYIGLNTQKITTNLETCFPSKILFYLTRNLKVVTGKTNSLRTSDVNDLVYYYITDDPLSISECIKQCTKDININTKGYLDDLDNNFIKNLYSLLCNT